MDRNLLPAIAAFAEVAREGSYTRAAGRIGISPSGLSQAIRTLEQQLGVRLLNRSTRSVSLTDDGRKLLAQVEPGLAMISHAVVAVGDAREKPSGEIRLNAPRVVSHHFIEPYLGEFARRYPEVRVELFIDDGLGDIVREGCDAGIRLRESVTDTMVAVPITPPVSLAVVGSPAYFASNPPPKDYADLANHNCLGFRQSSSGAVFRWELTDPKSGEERLFQPVGTLATNNDDVMLRAALQGVGLIMHLDFAVRQHLASGALVSVMEDWCLPFEGFNIYVPSRDQMPAKLRAFVDFLVEKRRQLAR
ncbi:LysR family transcriptional regulator [Agrobacterium sp. SUL3]|uniref:LysR family transcriptional regulator n=1 Tax=Agrobacterium sp. SUL3 TaxID=1701910 RepID=UPI0009E51260|nr:LysR family transcriptional regulator [Agrobacterium sp. SUL3]